MRREPTHQGRRLAAPRNEICAVGDDDQAIYRFRGATVRSFLNGRQEGHVSYSVNISCKIPSAAEIAADLSRPSLRTSRWASTVRS